MSTIIFRFAATSARGRPKKIGAAVFVYRRRKIVCSAAHSKKNQKGGSPVRMMLKITFPTEVGNGLIKDGSFSKIMQATMTKIKPEASYFVAENGCRCAMLFFDMQDVSDIPAIAEPLFMGLDARIEILPAMNVDDLKKGLAAAMKDL
jgi:hypothetical protein